MNSKTPNTLAIIAVAALVAILLPLIPLVNILDFPFRLLVTIVHELGHGLAAIFTGGSYDGHGMATSAEDLSLPVQLSSFSAIAGDKSVTLEWTTQSETNNMGFIIRRATGQTNVYEEIAGYQNNDQLRGAGNSSQKQQIIQKDSLGKKNYRK